jgi:hypothetical protein
MAGDLDIDESVIVLRDEPAADEAVELLTQNGAGVVHRYGPRVLVAEVSAPTREALLSQFADAVIADDAAQLLARPGVDLDETGRRGVEALAYRQSPEYAERKANRPHDGQPWNAPGMSSPQVLPALERTTEDLGEAPPAWSDRLLLKVFVGIVAVSGPGPELTFTEAELTKVWAETQNGLSWLAAQSPASHVVWVYDQLHETVSAPPIPEPPPPNPTPEDYEKYEAVWRDPALQQMGYSPGMDGVIAYIEERRLKRKTSWTYCAFVTKYQLAHFAYAAPGGPRLAMEYANDGWTPENIDRVFAHESGHIFHAPDEYKPCKCDGEWGYFKRPNANCEECAPSQGTPCIMKQNDWEMCRWTSWHLGFQWPASLPINDSARSQVTPAGVAFKGKLYLFYPDGEGRLLCSVSADNGTTWSKGQPIHTITSATTAPAAAVEFNGKLYVFFSSDDSWIYYSSSADGTSWGNVNRVIQVDKTPNTPAAAVFNKKLYVFFQDATDYLFYCDSFDGSRWSNAKNVNPHDRTPFPQTAAAFYGKLYLFFKSADSSNEIIYCESSNGSNWSLGQSLPEEIATPAPPAVVADEGGLYLFFKANDSSKKILYCESTDGTQWSFPEPINNDDQSDLTPATISDQFNGQLYVFSVANDHSIQETTYRQFVGPRQPGVH